VQYEIFREITPLTSAAFDADQNISDFNQINNNINRVYGLMDCFSLVSATGQTVSPDKKKGAQCAPLTPTESLAATARSHHHKTRPQYRYLPPAVV
jgi:hypothetical protein